MQEVQEVLDMMLPPPKKVKDLNGANYNTIMNAVCSVSIPTKEGTPQEKEQETEQETEKRKKKEQERKQEIEQAINNAIRIIAGIMQPYITPYNVNHKAPSGPPKLPHIIKQALFYIAVVARQNNICNNKDIIEMLKLHGVAVSHNFFAREPQTPSKYLEMMSQGILRVNAGNKSGKTFELLAPYKGQKVEELSHAIKNLAYQATEVDRYVDVFGGSGAATVAMRSLGVACTYNEINIATYNLFRALTEKDGVEKLIEQIKYFKEAVLKSDPYPGISDKDIEDALNAHFNKSKSKTIREDVDSLRNIKDDKINWYNLYAYTAYFVRYYDNYPKKNYSGTDIKLAIAELLIKSLSVRCSGNPLSAILNESRVAAGIKDKEEISKKMAPSFLKKEHDLVIRNLHKYVSGVECINDDCVNVIKKISKPDCNENVVFYCDSPYLETSDYKNEEKGASRFTPEKMRELVSSLKASNQKFIFSCRLTKRLHKNPTPQKIKNNYQTNTNIIADTFLPFVDLYEEDEYRDLYVLEISQQAGFVQSIKDNKATEIMITNYKIVDLPSLDNGMTFTVYEFIDFLWILTRDDRFKRAAIGGIE